MVSCMHEISFFFPVPFLLIVLCFRLFFFSDSQALLCDFHREQAWLHWFPSTNNVMMEYKEVCLQLLWNIATSETFGEYTLVVNKLKEHEIWPLPKASGFRDWVYKTWLQFYQACYLTACQFKDAFASNTHHFLFWSIDIFLKVILANKFDIISSFK